MPENSEQQVEKIKFKKATSATPPAQGCLDIAEIKENTVVLKDGSLRSVLLVSSLNFDLKSEEEQEAIIGNYIGFLNSLDFPIQIIIQSRRLNIDNYLTDLAKKEREQKNELLRLQIADYRQAIKELLDLGQIMSKRFLVVVPYSAAGIKPKGFWQRLTELLSPVVALRLEEKRFALLRHELDRRVEKVSSGLASLSIRAQELDTLSLIELFYNTYNPDLADKEKINDYRELRVEE